MKTLGVLAALLLATGCGSADTPEASPSDAQVCEVLGADEAVGILDYAIVLVERETHNRPRATVKDARGLAAEFARLADTVTADQVERDLRAVAATMTSLELAVLEGAGERRIDLAPFEAARQHLAELCDAT